MFLVSFTIRRINTNSFNKCFSQYGKKRTDHKQLLGYMEKERERKTWQWKMALRSNELYMKYPQMIGSWGKTEIYLSPDP